MEWLFATIIFLAALLSICLLLAVPMVRRHPLKKAGSPTDFNLVFEEISFLTEDGITLRGYWIPEKDSSRAIIMLHGFSGSLDPDLRYTPHLHNAGFNILMFDFRAHGRSGGCVTSLGALETRDVRAAVKWARDKGNTWVGLLGFSMGGRVALMAAPSFHPLVNTILSDGCPPRLVTAVTQNLALRGFPYPIGWLLARMMLIGASLITGSNLFTNDPLFKQQSPSEIPVMFFHGEKDRYAAQQEMITMMQIAGANARLWQVPEARHRNIEDTRPEEYIQKMISFFTQT